jgi:hypothetical protein
VTTPITVAALREALGSASAADGGATARLTEALEAIGWREGDSAGPAEVAQELLPAIASCAREHGDLGVLYRQLSEVLRASGPALDGGMPPASSYVPAAAELLRRFVG